MLLGFIIGKKYMHGCACRRQRTVGVRSEVKASLMQVMTSIAQLDNNVRQKSRAVWFECQCMTPKCWPLAAADVGMCASAPSRECYAPQQRS